MPSAVEPAPPFADGAGLPWDVPVADAVAQIAQARAACGDTFAIRSGDDNYLFTFSPEGVDAFYALPEEKASKGLADFLMLRRKLPDEIFDGRRLLPSALFRRDDVASYLANLDRALEATVSEMGTTGSVDLFALTRRLGHRMGLASWAGRRSAEGETFDRLVLAFDILDGSAAFVHPDAMAAVAASGKRAERDALDEITTLLRPAIDAGDDGLFGRIIDAWDGEIDDIRYAGIAFDVALIHIASMSNMASALGWAMVDLIEHPVRLPDVRAGVDDVARRCALESVRLAHRSIMSRTVLAPVSLNTGVVTYAVPPGWTIATLLPLLNTSVASGLAEWDPDRWNGYRIAAAGPQFSATLVTAFGHGKHSCPAQPFSLSAMTTAMRHLFGRYEFTPLWTTHPRPVPAQIGGVARAADECVVEYTAPR